MSYSNRTDGLKVNSDAASFQVKVPDREAPPGPESVKARSTLARSMPWLKAILTGTSSGSGRPSYAGAAETTLWERGDEGPFVRLFKRRAGQILEAGLNPGGDALAAGQGRRGTEEVDPRVDPFALALHGRVEGQRHRQRPFNLERAPPGD